MDRVLPVAEAVLMGTVDSIENFAINIRDKLPRFGKQQEQPECLSGKVAIVTGANAGIGYATARKLAERGAHVVLACRSKERGQQAATELSAVPPLLGCAPGSVEFSPLDLSSLSSVRDFARRFNRAGRALDVLVCNAGIMSPPQRLVSEDGLELQFQVNFLSHWLLAHELLSEQRRRRAKAAKKHGHSKPAAPTVNTTTIINGSRSSSSSRACCCGGVGADGTRLVMLSSLTHPAGSIKWNDKQSLSSYSPFTSYALSKLCNTMMAAEYQRRFDRHDPCTYGHDSAVAIHPGIVATSLATGFFTQTGTSALPGLQAVVTPLLNVLFPLLLRTPESSADSMMLAVTGPAHRLAGRYMHNDRVTRPTRVRAAFSPRGVCVCCGCFWSCVEWPVKVLMPADNWESRGCNAGR